MESKLFSPLFIMLPRKTMKDRKYILNLNNYRNWHRISSGHVKDAYTDLMGDQMREVWPFKKISLTFKYFRGSKRSCDRANIYSVHEKFFCDALVYWGVIEDDSDEFIKQSIYLPVEYDKENPRVEVTITEV